MTSLRNLPLAVRLGGAFGALCLGLAIVAFTGLNAMGGLRAASDDLAERHLEAAGLLGGLQERTKGEVSLAAQHLYVRDGDLSGQDEIADKVTDDDTLIDRDVAALGKLLADTGAGDAFDRYAATLAKLTETVDKALERSRTETIQNVEERDGSRNLYTEQVLELDGELEDNAEALVAATKNDAGAAVKDAEARAA
jgi:hypothetical protein